MQAQTQSIHGLLSRAKRPLVHQAYPQFVGILKPHVGHRIVCVQKDGLPVVLCESCGVEFTGNLKFNPRIMEAVGTHVGHVLKCVTRGNEVYVVCECGKDVVGSTPF